MLIVDCKNVTYILSFTKFKQTHQDESFDEMINNEE